MYLLNHLLERSAAAYPNRPAVVDGDRSLSYLELEERSNRLAHLLIEIGIERGDRLGLYLDKSLEAVIGIYGVLKAGAAYVPLDPQAPAKRIGYIARNCEISCLLTGTEKSTLWASLLEAGAPMHSLVVLNAATVDVEAAGLVAQLACYAGPDIDRQPAVAPDVRTIDLDLAYILYTSGSTGEPKGVKLSHLNALGFVRWAVREFAVRPDDRLSSHAPLHFDLSVFDLFAAAEAGAAVVLVPPKTSMFPGEVARFIAERGITIWYSVPSILSMLTTRGGLKVGDLPGLRTLLFAGEVFPTKYLRQLMALLTHVRFCNLYGPTETNVCTWFDVPQLSSDDDTTIPIGRAIDNVEVFPVTEEGKRAAPGEVGELYVRGSTVMRGYWGDPERTARVLPPHPLDIESRDLVYRTGDLVQQDDDGNYRFLGRRDSQIKSRGYRIELGEIESALYAHPGVVECAAVAVPDEIITNRIQAFVVTRSDTSEAELIRFCAERIPRYMVPERFEFCDSLRKTSTGKIDRQSLRAQAG